MNNAYEKLQKHSDDLLEIALKYDDLRGFLLGMPGYEVIVRDSIGEKVNSTDAVMQSIYNRYRKNLGDNIDQKFYETLSQVIDVIKSGKYLLRIISEVEYQLRSEKNGIAPFSVDCKSLLDKIKLNITNNKDIYEKPLVELNTNNGYFDSFRNHDELLQENYGHKIL